MDDRGAGHRARGGGWRDARPLGNRMQCRALLTFHGKPLKDGFRPAFMNARSTKRNNPSNPAWRTARMPRFDDRKVA
jgi:hypothetical protein